MTGEKIVKQAEKYKGESGSKFCKSYGFDYVVDWCCIFVWYVFKQCKTTGLFPKCAYVPTADSWLRKNAKFIKNYKNAKPGDIIIFTWDGNGYNSRTGRRQHIGIVVEWKNGKMHTIEGNTGSENCKKSKVNYRVASVVCAKSTLTPVLTCQSPRWPGRSLGQVRASDSDPPLCPGQRSVLPSRPSRL